MARVSILACRHTKWPRSECVKRKWPGHRQVAATPFFERLCPATGVGCSSLLTRRELHQLDGVEIPDEAAELHAVNRERQRALFVARAQSHRCNRIG